MTTTNRETLSKLAAMFGLLLVLASPGLSLGQWYSERSPLETLAWFEQNRAPGDSAGHASAVYHAAHARASVANRWKPTGYGTLGVIGTLAGIGFLFAGRRRRDA